MKTKLALLVASLIILGGCYHATNKSPAMQKPQPQGQAPAGRVFPEKGSTVRDTTKMPDDFSIIYRYGGGVYVGAGEYTIALKESGVGLLSWGDRTESFTVSDEALEKVFDAMVQKNIFDATPWAVVRWQEFLGPVFGMGGSQASLKVQADRTMTEFPPLPSMVRKNNIDLDRVLRTKGIPSELNRAALEDMVTEAEDLSEIFTLIAALVPDDVRAKMGQ